MCKETFPKADANLRREELKILTRKDVLESAHPDTLCLLIIGSDVYDCTRWQYNHPGAPFCIRALCGKDATEPFMGTHTATVMKSLKHFHYATLEDSKVDKITESYRELTAVLQEEKMFETDYFWYLKLFAWLASIFASVLAGVLLSDNFAVHCLAGVLLGLFWQQTAFVGHDLGHNGITHNRKYDSRLGLFFGNFCTGVGMGWWKRSHNTHHVCTNVVEDDPDIQHLPIFALHKRFLKAPVFSSFYDRYLPLSAVTHALVKYQHWTYYPVMAFARFNLYAQGILEALRVGAYANDLPKKVQKADLFFLAGFWIWLVSLVLCLPTWKSRIAFFVLAHNVAGLLHVQITLSHFAMPIYCRGDMAEDNCNNFVKEQIATGMDVDCHPWMDWFHGGLQFQVVHHLWPRVPRHNLRKLQTRLIQFCKKHEIRYHRASFFEANRQTIAKLRETAAHTDSLSEIFSDSANLNG
jgi:fatty acid desaturase